jgi:hypothetical protein
MVAAVDAAAFSKVVEQSSMILGDCVCLLLLLLKLVLVLWAAWRVSLCAACVSVKGFHCSVKGRVCSFKHSAPGRLLRS